MSEISLRLKNINERIEKVGLSYKKDVRLLAVSKGHSSLLLRQAYSAGIRNFGENYLQEGIKKQLELVDLPSICWHFIGSIQKNKIKEIAKNFSWVHSVDNYKVAFHLSEKRPVNMPALKIGIQVNLTQDSSKSGCSVIDLPDLVNAVRSLPRLQLSCLMLVPRLSSNIAEQNDTFRRMFELRDSLGISSSTSLSMGMSRDFEIAIANGSNWIRIGTALFGPRKKKIR